MISTRKSERGSALVIAMAAAVIVSIIVAVVMNLSIRRFELSAQRTDHEVAKMSSEAGLQYVFARLDIDAAFRTAVQNKRIVGHPAAAVPLTDATAEYVITCDAALIGADQVDPRLHVGAKINTEVNADGTPGPQNGQYVGGKHVTIRIRFLTAADLAANPNFDAARPYRIRVDTNFAEG